MIAFWRDDRVSAERVLPRHYVETMFATILLPPLVGVLLSPMAGDSGVFAEILFVAKVSIVLSWSGVVPGVILMGILQRLGWGGLGPVLILSILLLPFMGCLYMHDSCTAPNILSKLRRLPSADLAVIAMSFAALAWAYVCLRVSSGIRSPVSRTGPDRL